MIQAIHRPRFRDVMILGEDGDCFVVPAADVLPLADALREAAGMPAFANELARSGDQQGDDL